MVCKGEEKRKQTDEIIIKNITRMTVRYDGLMKNSIGLYAIVRTNNLCVHVCFVLDRYLLFVQ